MRAIFIFVFIFSFCVSCINHTVEGQHLPYTVTAKVIHLKDGDSFVVLDAKNNKIEIRLLDIDAPELHQPFGKKAKEHLSNLIKEKNVTINYEKKDRYGRLLAHVFLNKLNLNQEMIRAGYAWHFTRYSTNKKLQKLENNARKKHLGLWYDKNPTAPWIWRAEHKRKKKSK